MRFYTHGGWSVYFMVVVAGIVLTGRPGSPAVTAQETRSVWDGVYTRPQAIRGEDLFASECSRCHAASDFVGEGFIASWEGATLRDFYLYLSSLMPPDVHEGLTDFQAYSELIAHLLRSNDIPPGEAELTDDLDGLGMIRIERLN